MTISGSFWTSSKLVLLRSDLGVESFFMSIRTKKSSRGKRNILR